MTITDSTGHAAYAYAKDEMQDADKPNILACQVDDAVEAMCESIDWDSTHSATKFVVDDRIMNIEVALFRALCEMNGVDINALSKMAAA